MLAIKSMTIPNFGSAGLSRTSDKLERLGHKLLGVFFGHDEGIEGVGLSGLTASAVDVGKIKLGEGLR